MEGDGLKKPWELSVLAAAGIGLVVALICIIFMQQIAITRLETRLDIMEVVIETCLVPLEGKMDRIIRLGEETDAGHSLRTIAPETQATNSTDTGN